MSGLETSDIPPPGQPPAVVACLGSSSTAGKGQAWNWIHELERRPALRRFTFCNFGVGGDLSWNALQRFSEVAASSPQKLVVLVGSNDVLAIVFDNARRFYLSTRELPRDPSLQWFEENLRAIVRRAQTETSASIGLCSLPPIGEDLSSTHPAQSALNRCMLESTAIIRAIAREQHTAYIPLHEAMTREIRLSPGLAFTRFRFLPFYRDAFRTVILRKSPDDVARMNGWRFHSDGIHLNSRGGRIVADLVQTFLEQ